MTTRRNSLAFAVPVALIAFLTVCGSPFTGGSSDFQSSSSVSLTPTATASARIFRHRTWFSGALLLEACRWQREPFTRFR
jgi:hypothetical protein